MRSIPAALVCLALLCGCVMDPTYGDPYAAKAQAQGAIEATQAARAGMAAEATMGAGRTQDAMWISATQYAWAELAAQAMVTQEAAQALGTSQAIETATTWPKTATMGAQQALLEVQAMRATSTALGLEIRQAQEEVRRKEAFSWVWMIAAALLVLGMTVICVWAVWMVIGHWVEWEDRKHSLVQANGQVIVYKVGPDGQYAPEVLGGRRLLVNGRRVSGLDEVREVTASGSVLEAPLRRDVEQSDVGVMAAKGLLLDAVTQGWGQGDRIPSWRKMKGWSSPRWQRAMGPLKAAGVVEVGVDGTYVYGYVCVADLWQAIKGGKVVIHPAPPEGD